MPISSETNRNRKTATIPGKIRNSNQMGVQQNQQQTISSSEKGSISAASLKISSVPLKPYKKPDTPILSPRRSGTGNRCSMLETQSKKPELRKGSCPHVLIGSNADAPSWTNLPETRSQRRNSFANETIITQPSMKTDILPRPDPENSKKPDDSKIVISKQSVDKQIALPTNPPPITISSDSPVHQGRFADQEIEMKRFLMEIFMRSITGACASGSGQQLLVDQLGISKCNDFGISDFLTQKSVEEDEEDESSEAQNFVLEVPAAAAFSDSDQSMESIEPTCVTIETDLNVNSEPEPELVEQKSLVTTESEVIADTSTASDKARSVAKMIRELSLSSTGSLGRPSHPIPMNPKKPFVRHISLPATHFLALTKAGILEKAASSAGLMHQDFKRRYLNQQYVKLMGKFASISAEDVDNSSGQHGDDNRSSTSSFGKLLQRAYSISNNSNWSRSTSISIDDFREMSFGEFEASPPSGGCCPPADTAFTTDLEKQAINMRNLRRLRRQETMQNIAPANYCNT